MISFLDGPAAGVTLSLHRAPVILRVVRKGRAWDALDQPADEAAADEEIFVYRIVGQPTMMHLSCRPRSRSGWYPVARYKMLPDQPGDDHVRSTKRWREWCESNKDYLLVGFPS